MTQSTLFQLLRTSRHVNARKSYLHFGNFSGEAILCSNLLYFSLFFSDCISVIRLYIFCFVTWAKISNVCLFIKFILTKNGVFFAKMSCQLRPSCFHMTICHIRFHSKTHFSLKRISFPHFPIKRYLTHISSPSKDNFYFT